MITISGRALASSTPLHFARTVARCPLPLKPHSQNLTIIGPSARRTPTSNLHDSSRTHQQVSAASREMTGLQPL